VKKARESQQASPPPPVILIDGRPISFPDGGPGIAPGTDGRAFSSAAAIGQRRLRPTRWREKRCVRELARHLGGGDELREIMSAMNRLGCWRSCIAQFTRGPGGDAPLGASLLGFWTGYGLNRIPAGLKEDLPVFVDALRHHLTAYTGPGVTLYRGEDAARYRAGVYGIEGDVPFPPKLAS
jgi:hypothetical protein